jgi:hypothetical protein
MAFETTMRLGGPARSGIAIASSALFLIGFSNSCAAQAASDAVSDAKEARIDALLATPSLSVPAPQANLFATAPGLEEQAPAPKFTLNGLLPIGYNSNAEAAQVGGAAAAEISPVGSLSWSAAAFDLPLRVTASLRVESDRFINASQADLDKLGGSLRLQYVNPDNDQSFSPYLAYAPRADFAPTFALVVATRQDLNLGFNKTFNFDAAWQRIAPAGNTRALTVWSFGLTVFAQRRFRDPAPSSSALYLIPSLSYVITELWSFNFGVETIWRRFDRNVGFRREDWLVEPIATLEFAAPAAWFGAEDGARLIGRPALDFQASYETASANLPTVAFSRWTASVALKTGWRF